jgi:hypothetical protein
MISHCLNKELGAYGFKSYTSPDRTMVLINDETMSKVVDFFHGTGYKPYFTKEQIERVKTIQKVSTDNKISIYWAQSGFKRKYYYLKQYGFNGLNLYHVLNLNGVNMANAAVSSTGAAALSMSGMIALSWTGSLFFATLENYIPNNMVKTKIVVSGAKLVTSLPIRCAEWTTNKIFGVVENVVLGSPLPINITAVYKLNVGPKLEDLEKIKKPIVQWLLNQVNN